MRSFLFALTSQNNSFDISNKTFLKGCSRFGIDSPYPSISQKLYLYGNDINIADYVKDKRKIKNYKTNYIAIPTAQPNLAVQSSNQTRMKPDKNVIIGVQNMKMLESKKTKQFSKQHPKVKQSSAILDTQINTQTNVKVVVPSFGTCSALFSQHFSILRELKKKIEKYKNMFEEQRDEENSWNCLENVMKILDTALAFLVSSNHVLLIF
jgi:hypothetical protein